MELDYKEIYNYVQGISQKRLVLFLEWSRKVDDETEKRGLLSEKDKNQSTRTRACLTQRRKKLMEGMA